MDSFCFCQQLGSTSRPFPAIRRFAARDLRRQRQRVGARPFVARWIRGVPRPVGVRYRGFSFATPRNHSPPLSRWLRISFAARVARDVIRREAYLHDGRALTLKDVLTTHNAEKRHGNASDLSPQQLDDLIARLLSL